MERSKASVGDWLRWTSLLGSAPFAGPEAAWSPAVDVYRTPEGWLLKFELAGVRREDVRILVEGRRLTVEGVRRDRSAQATGQCYSLEITYSRFSRSIELPGELRAPRVAAECEDGMLIVHVQEGR
jgi:HSP20 family protein